MLFHFFQRWHSAEEFSCRRNIGFLHGLLDLSHNKSRPVVSSIRVALISVFPTQGTLSCWLLLHPCPYEGRAPGRPCRDTIGLPLVLFALLFLFQALRHARRRQRFPPRSSLRAVAVQLRMLPRSRVLRRLQGLRERLRKDSTNSTGYRADANPFFTCACLSGSIPETL